jgi:transcriptional antiterminator NusG
MAREEASVVDQSCGTLVCCFYNPLPGRYRLDYFLYSPKSSPVISEENREVVSTEKGEMRWYAVQVYTGQENQIKNLLEAKIRAEGMEPYFSEILLPEEEVIEIVKGKKRKVRKRFYPGYLLVRMILNETTLSFLRKTGKVGTVVGDMQKPIPLSEEEVEKIRSRMEQGKEKPRVEVRFDVGDVVKITDGPFANFTGTVQEVKPDQSKVRLMVSIFGRSVPVDVDFTQLEKA